MANRRLRVEMNLHDKGFVVAQILSKHPSGTKHNLTGIQLRLPTIKLLAARVNPEGNRFDSIFYHSNIEGLYGPAEGADASDNFGDIFELLDSLYFLKYKVKTPYERDEIRRWIWTCEYALNHSDMQTFNLGYIKEEDWRLVI